VADLDYKFWRGQNNNISLLFRVLVVINVSINESIFLLFIYILFKRKFKNKNNYLKESLRIKIIYQDVIQN